MEASSGKEMGPEAGRMAAPEPVFLDAKLYPYRSLSPGAFALIVAGFGLAAFLLGTGFWLLGAWPVMGFCGLEIVLLWLAFRWSYRSALLMEHLHLTRHELVIERHEIGGQVSRWSLQPYWLQVLLDEPPQSDSPLFLVSHGQALQIGKFLPPAERFEVAEALRNALRASRDWREGEGQLSGEGRLGPAGLNARAQMAEDQAVKGDPTPL